MSRLSQHTKLRANHSKRNSGDERTRARTEGWAGFSDWQRIAKKAGQISLATMLESMDPGNVPSGKNVHHVIAERLRHLGLPTHAYVALSGEAFLADPAKYFAKIPDGDYYFASIKPGIHLAHCRNQDRVVDFVRKYCLSVINEVDRGQELYLIHNSEPTLSGHIIVSPGESPNPVFAEFTNGNFNTFHRGYSSPEIIVQRSRYRFEWRFDQDLDPGDGDWQTSRQYECNGGLSLSRPQIAEKIFDAIQKIPHDDHVFLPGYYEVLIENTGGYTTRPIFIEANFSYAH